MVSFQQLRMADPGTLRGAADAARKVARELEQFGTDTDRHRVGLAAAWSGTDSDAAGGVLANQFADYRNTAASYRRVDSIVSMLAGEMDGARQILESAISMAPSIPGRVGEDGSVHINWAALGSSPSPAAVSAAQQRAQQVAGYIRQAVMRATEADQRAQGELVGLVGATNVRLSGTTAPRIPAEGTDPRQVNEWWDGLTDAQREQLIQSNPHAIGGLDGVPVAARDQANRLDLAQERGPLLERRAALQERLDSLGYPSRGDYGYAHEHAQVSRELRQVNDRIANIDSLREQMARTDLQGSTERLYLIDYDSAADGRAVISVGNPDLADNVVTYVPGTTADVPGIGGDVNRSLWMQADAAAADPSRTTAAVTWLGYDAPDHVVPNAIFDHYYEDAAADLTSFQQGLRATHEGAPSLNTLMGHSYGASTIGHAAHNADLGVDNLVQVASPGGGFGRGDNASDYIGLTPEHVWATRAGDDPIRFVSQIHGNDPMDEDFGGRTFPAGDGGHSGYWNADNEARRHMANIITGQYDRVPSTQHPVPQP
ncbi:alpha/beta hydrolase family protein [Stackebrandtia albiflava]|uniref:Alpha/beta hydrolase family protein n=1 Tax=Stackebrandtia albiflava TaxID=406432 RepID=A0A562UR32_9ACTN|nr:alpha/beta hydrolase [Stackebrandtia albiflava]TWJ08071.1 alpha/beta hydrolase family protein [Stackebrandtia albiflava]